MSQPRFHAYDPKSTMPFFSTRSLAIASLVVAGCGIIAALSPLLFPAFLPVALVGLVLAVFGLFSYRDRSTLQVAAMSVNGLLVLVALLRGPVALQSVDAAEFEPWSPSIALNDSQPGLQGWVLQSERFYADGRRGHGPRAPVGPGRRGRLLELVRVIWWSATAWTVAPTRWSGQSRAPSTTERSRRRDAGCRPTVNWPGSPTRRWTISRSASRRWNGSTPPSSGTTVSSSRPVGCGPCRAGPWRRAEPTEPRLSLRCSCPSRRSRAAGPRRSPAGRR